MTIVSYVLKTTSENSEISCLSTRRFANITFTHPVHSKVLIYMTQSESVS